MKINRRDVVNVAFGSNTRDNHMVIVLSLEEINDPEEQFLRIMITDSSYYDTENEFSFPLDNSMFRNPLKEKASRVRLYLINFLPNTCVISKVNEMHNTSFEAMIKDLNKKIFGVQV